jgi:hypothetical protein
MMLQADYHSDKEHVSRSKLVLFATSRRKFKRHEDGDYDDEENDVLRIGSGTHAIALKDAVALGNIVKIPDNVLTVRKDGVLVKAGNRFNSFRLATKNRGKTLLLQKQWQLCNDVAEALGRVKIAEDPNGKKILISDLVNRKDVERELEHRWNDVLPCRLKADLVLPLPGLTICLDLKTARSINPKAFWTEVRDRKLWLQDAHYSAGLEDKYQNPVRFCFVVCEKTWPYESRVFEMGPSTRALARIGHEQLLEQLKECRRTGIYLDPPKDDSIEQLELSEKDMGIEL